MKLASFDIGIKHMAYCILDIDANNIKIIDWDVVNILNEKINLCQAKTKKGLICNKKAMNKTSENDCYCGTHAKKYKTTKIKQKKLKSYNTQELCECLVTKLNTIDSLKDIHTIVVENQPSCNPSMKKISYMLYSYFIMKGIDKTPKTKVVFFAPKNKLKAYTGPFIKCDLTNPYKKRKFLGTAYCEKMIGGETDAEHLSFFKSHKKKDDLADCYLQGVHYFRR
jgi:hypothetical protein